MPHPQESQQQQQQSPSSSSSPSPSSIKDSDLINRPNSVETESLGDEYQDDDYDVKSDNGSDVLSSTNVSRVDLIKRKLGINLNNNQGISCKI
jgi:hypothetical protein